MPDEAYVRRWVTEDKEGFAARYVEARDYAIDHMADEIIKIAAAASPTMTSGGTPENQGFGR